MIRCVLFSQIIWSVRPAYSRHRRMLFAFRSKANGKCFLEIFSLLRISMLAFLRPDKHLIILITIRIIFGHRNFRFLRLLLVEKMPARIEDSVAYCIRHAMAPQKKKNQHLDKLGIILPLSLSDLLECRYTNLSCQVS